MSSIPETQNNKDPGRHKEKETMPSKDKVKKKSDQQGDEARPFTVFYVNPETPEEVHTDTVMARDCENALAIAAELHRMNTILHVRGIGEPGFSTDCDPPAETVESGPNHFPCARFINGKFLAATFSDDTLLENLTEQA